MRVGLTLGHKSSEYSPNVESLSRKKKKSLETKEKRALIYGGHSPPLGATLPGTGDRKWSERDTNAVEMTLMLSPVSLFHSKAKRIISFCADETSDRVNCSSVPFITLEHHIALLESLTVGGSC